jgi:mRNA-degrading endonuclease RelE of RelBE toxin-antitoxin system
MQVKIHELAVKEFDQAIEWYGLQSKDLGERFKKTVIKQIDKIQKNPSWYLVEADNIYKAYIPKFPFKILYTIDKSVIIVWAISHMHREPWYWQERLI